LRADDCQIHVESRSVEMPLVSRLRDDFCREVVEYSMRGDLGESWLALSEMLIERSEEHTSELQSLAYLVCRLLLEKKKDILSIAVNIPSWGSQGRWNAHLSNIFRHLQSRDKRVEAGVRGVLNVSILLLDQSHHIVI